MSNQKEIAAKLFAEWYEYCLESGIMPEQIVEEFGEMRLLTTEDELEKFNKMND